MSSGENILCEIVSGPEEMDNGIIVTNRPLQMILRHENEEVMMYLTKWIPGSRDQFIVINMVNVVAVTPVIDTTSIAYQDKAMSLYGERDIDDESMDEDQIERILDDSSSTVSVPKDENTLMNFLKCWNTSKVSIN